ncbi:antibiotic biosynthesis monooxygenase [Aestuariicella hydrocarbonica]|uniref:Antibiotic biosynthesis monooxygenase n=1 Tax=Pseudomaricurvus hydrocarbonicus TaxID=1470433 RepID=A0A9E5K144_9GAMM|nr:antibiotic biosynthesis monooxygenase family protein [Aestuariicella hydrocarbonica]NHO66872.1 antibiotic biosynthesis monooxygenase [Aestuariicella hydrocarbonica]
MIYEIAEIDITPGSEHAFESAVKKASEQFREAKGCRSLKLQRCIENRSRYHLVVGWDSVDDHMVTFRNSDAFQMWRQLASPFFATPPQVEHYECAIDAF